MATINIDYRFSSIGHAGIKLNKKKTVDVVVAGRHTNELNPQYKGSQKFTIRHCHEICNNYFA